MTVISYLRQTKHFWQSVLRGPERKLGQIAEDSELHDLVEEIRKWLCSQLQVPDSDMTFVRALKNPHSEVFLYQKSNGLENLDTILVKRYIIQLENRNEIYLEGLRHETESLKLLSEFNGRFQVWAPIIHAWNEDLYLVATNFQKGNSFFNVLFESPLKVAAGRSRVEEYQKCLSNLGRWLRAVHGARLNFSREKASLKEVLDRDLPAVEERLSHLNNVRPADFSSHTCQRIRRVYHAAAKEILETSPQLVTIHGDFAPSNMIYHSGDLTVLDYATFGWGLPAEDLARIFLDFVNIENYSYIFSPKLKGVLASAFYSGYGTKKGRNDAAWRFYLIKHCVIYLYVFTKHWGNRNFLNPFLCRLFYSYQKNFLSNLVQ